MRDLGKPVLLDPLVNKGTAFLWSERERFHLRGLLPARMVTMAEQVCIHMLHLRKTVRQTRRGLGLLSAVDRSVAITAAIHAPTEDEAKKTRTEPSR